MRLLCVCPNPAIDHTVIVDHIGDSETSRADKSLTTAGGKGLNIARFAGGFGIQAQAATWCGALGAEYLHALSKRDGLNLATTLVPGAGVRICPIVVSTKERRVISTSDPPPIIDPRSWARFVDLVKCLALDADVVCVAGSYPVVDSVNPVEALLGALKSHPRVWLDTSGDALVTVVERFQGMALKVNLAEALDLIACLQLSMQEDISDLDLKSRALSACHTLGRKVDDLIVTAGPVGAAHAVKGDLRWLSSPAVESRNPTASGDAFMAGYVSAGTGALTKVDDPLLAGLCAGAVNAASWFPQARAEYVVDLALATHSRGPAEQSF